MTSLIIDYEKAPFCIGACLTPHNPLGLPDTYPLTLDLDERLGLLRLRNTHELENLLERAYSLGALMGTPLADTPLGVGYVDDFLGFINEHGGPPKSALEIGAGTGYLSARLIQCGWSVDSLEPGTGYETYWHQYGIEVIRDFFPSSAVKGPYDLIVAYAVFEHVSDCEDFLSHVAQYLKPNGVFVLSVPDCTDEISSGDPAMLLHEHYQYFTKLSLDRTLASSGFRVTAIKSSGYGRAIYAAACPDLSVAASLPSDPELNTLRAFGANCRRFQENIAERAKKLVLAGKELGIYCPSRALAALPHNIGCRFFDDAPELTGKFYPPFLSRVESRTDLLQKPTDELWVMSRTFGPRLAEELRSQLPNTLILLIDEL